MTHFWGQKEHELCHCVVLEAGDINDWAYHFLFQFFLLFKDLGTGSDPLCCLPVLTPHNCFSSCITSKQNFIKLKGIIDVTQCLLLTPILHFDPWPNDIGVIYNNKKDFAITLNGKQGYHCLTVFPVCNCTYMYNNCYNALSISLCIINSPQQRKGYDQALCNSMTSYLW